VVRISVSSFTRAASPAVVAAGFQPGGTRGNRREVFAVVDSGRQDAALCGSQGWLPLPPDAPGRFHRLQKVRCAHVRAASHRRVAPP
jgi:hypothetical protein